MDSRWDAVGASRGTVALLHGVGSSAATWWRVGPALAEQGWDVVALDLPAHGDRPAPDESLTAELLADQIVAELPDGGVELLVGHSLGGIVGAVIAARHPGVARAVVLEDPPGLGAVSPDVFAEVIAHDTELAWDDPDRLAARLRAVHPRWTDTDVQVVVGGLRCADADAVVGGLRAGLRWDVPALVGAAGCPVLVLAADERGSALRDDERRAVEAALPPGRFVVLDGAHALHRDQPDAWVTTVNDFGAGVGVTGR